MGEVGSTEAKKQLPEILARVQEGEDFTITHNGNPIAKIIPFQTAQRVEALNQSHVRGGKNKRGKESEFTLILRFLIHFYDTTDWAFLIDRLLNFHKSSRVMQEYLKIRKKFKVGIEYDSFKLLRVEFRNGEVILSPFNRNRKKPFDRDVIAYYCQKLKCYNYTFTTTKHITVKKFKQKVKELVRQK